MKLLKILTGAGLLVLAICVLGFIALYVVLSMFFGLPRWW